MSTDALTMLRRNYKHTLRNPVTVFNAVLLPVVIMLMFVYMLGNAFSVGTRYIDYATPGMILLAVAYGLGATATEVNADMTTGIISRLRVMDVSRGAILTGHVVITMLRSLISIAAIIAVAFGLGFRPHATAGDWLAVAGLTVATSFAASWLTVALGLAAKTPQSAAMATVPLVMLPFFSSAIVPAAKMGQGIRQFAEYQPFTPVIESLRGLLDGTPSTGYIIAALAWCTAIAITGYVWAVATFRKRV
jgi:ABC-2 type transport system permease protein